MGDICCNAFTYADDIGILSPTSDALRKIVRIYEQYVTQFSMSLNPLDSCIRSLDRIGVSKRRKSSAALSGRGGGGAVSKQVPKSSEHENSDKR